MPAERPQDIDEVLERALRDQPLDEHPEGHSEEIELHEPLTRERAEAMEIDSARTPYCGAPRRGKGAATPAIQP